MSDQPHLISPTLHTAGLAGLEALINQTLTLDPGSLLRLEKLSGHVFWLHCTSPELSVYLIPSDEGISLQGVYAGEADTRLTGSAGEFAKLLTADDPASALINGELQLHGDTQALIELQKIAKDLDIDWEAPLANVFGDVVGHHLGQGLRAGFSFGLQAFKSLRRQLDDYLVEESDWLAPRWQVDKFMNEVDQLAQRTERLQARLNKYRQQRAAKPSSPTGSTST